jgi:sulfatase maturation enzyme AslB (radical SAM superfamily)
MEALLKFQDPLRTAKGEERAYVDLLELKTLWFNTGSLCNLSCENCYIESSPKNDRLAFINESEVLSFLNEIQDQGLPVDLIGFTGGEPFANPHMVSILEKTLKEGFDVLVLTNAYKAIKKSFEKLAAIKDQYGEKLKIRVSLDHYSQEAHEQERGLKTFQETVSNIKWLVDNRINTSIAGRSLKREPIEFAMAGYQALFDSQNISLQLDIGKNIVIFPEMDQKRDVPEITTACWSILNNEPSDQMCATERMIIKKKGGSALTVMPCTLLAYDEQFELGQTLKDSTQRIHLNHPFCAEFCVLGGASCSSTK